MAMMTRRQLGLGLGAFLVTAPAWASGGSWVRIPASYGDLWDRSRWREEPLDGRVTVFMPGPLDARLARVLAGISDVDASRELLVSFHRADGSLWGDEPNPRPSWCRAVGHYAIDLPWYLKQAPKDRSTLGFYGRSRSYDVDDSLTHVRVWVPRAI